MTILLPVDGSPSSSRASELLAAYRGEAAINTLVLSVQADPTGIWPEAVFNVRAVEAGLLDAGRAIAEPAARRLKVLRTGAESVVRLGLPATEIVQEAKARGAGLILMGTRGHGAMNGFALGSVALRVVHASDTPVCLVRPEARLPAQLGRKLRVLLALDGSEPAGRAAQLLAAWREWLGELDVQIVHVQQPLTLLETVLPPHRDVIEQWSTRAGEEATQAARELYAKAGIRHHLHLSVGEPAHEIAQLADDLGCELLVMGTRGRGAAHHAFVGSVALKAAARSAIPVLLVK